MQSKALPSIYRDPFGNVIEVVFVEEHILESGERPFGVDCSALEKYVAVTLEIIAGRARP